MKIRTLDDTRRDLAAAVKALDAAHTFALDTETTSKNPRKALLDGISLATDDFVCNIPTTNESRRKPNGLPISQVLSALEPALTDPGKNCALHNAPYDRTVLRRAGLELRCTCFCTMMMAYCCDEHPPHGLKPLVDQRYDHTMITYAQAAQPVLPGLGPSMDEYAMDDARYTLKVYKDQRSELEADDKYPDGDSKMWKVYRDIENPCTEVIESMVNRGFPIDIPFLEQIQLGMNAGIRAMRLGLQERAGREINLESPRDIGWFLFKKEKLPVLERTPNGQASTKANVLERLVADGHEVATMLMKYRKHTKFLGTFVTPMIQMARAQDGVIHTSFRQAGTLTGRLSSSRPNLQNQPNIDPSQNPWELPVIRDAFIAGPGRKLAVVDYSGFELRLMAHMANESTMLRILNGPEGKNGPGDIHWATQQAIGVDYGRRRAKATNFGFLYRMGAKRFAYLNHVKLKDAQKFKDEFFKKYPGLAPYYKQVERTVRKHGYVRNICGRKRRLTREMQEDDFRAISQAINFTIQGAAADFIKIAMRNLHFDIFPKKVRQDKRWKTVGLISQVHDELIASCPDEIAEEVLETVSAAMKNVAKLRVRIDVEGAVGNTWAEAH